jgi:hypothetical protein
LRERRKKEKQKEERSSFSSPAQEKKMTEYSLGKEFKWYAKEMTQVFNDCLPKPGHECFVSTFDFSDLSGRDKIAVLSTKRIPNVVFYLGKNIIKVRRVLGNSVLVFGDGNYFATFFYTWLHFGSSEQHKSSNRKEKIDLHFFLLNVTINMKNRNNHEMERLETVGDSFLKLPVSIFTCRSTCAAHSVHESIPNALRDKRKTKVENIHLCNLGKV